MVVHHTVSNSHHGRRTEEDGADRGARVDRLVPERPIVTEPKGPCLEIASPLVNQLPLTIATVWEPRDFIRGCHEGIWG